MDDKKMIIIAVACVGAYLLMQRQRATQGGPGYAVPGRNTPRSPYYPTTQPDIAATQAAAYRGLGSLIGGIYNKIGGSAAQGAMQPRGEMGPFSYPDDGIAANPPSNVDPYAYEMSAWGDA